MDAKSIFVGMVKNILRKCRGLPTKDLWNPVRLHCPKCGRCMSEWFMFEGVMWCCTYARGCGYISNFATHKEYEENVYGR